MLLMTVFSQGVYSKCEFEKKRVDRYNSMLKNKATESARNGHRAAKSAYLDCLRRPTEEKAQTKSSTHSSSQTPGTSKTKYKLSPPKSSGHVTVSDYSNFKGKKKQAWALYFTESVECLSNKNDMKIFVACAKVRKQHLKIFNARWNNQTQELMPLLDNQ